MPGLILEPCCFNTQLDNIIQSIEGPGRTGVAHFFTFGDVCFAHYLDYFIRQAPGGEVFLALLAVTDDSVSRMAGQLEKKRGHDPLVSHLTLLTQGADRKKLDLGLGTFIRQGRVTVCEDRIAFRCLAVVNKERSFVLNGSINQTADYAMQMFTLTTGRKAGESVMQIFSSKERTKSIH